MDETLHFTTGDGYRIAYRLDGNADRQTLMLSNSIATSLHMWDDIIEALTQHYRVLRYDLRGHGASAVPPGAYSIDRLGRDVVELLDHLELERVHFCGISIGGFIGQWLGIVSPERLHRLVLSNTSPYVGPPEQWDELSQQTLKSDIAITADVLLERWFPKAMFDEHPETIAHFRKMILKTSPLGIVGCFAAVRDTDLRRTMSLIEVPTLVIAGEDDTPTLPEHSRALVQAMPKGELRFLSGIHLLSAEHPQEFVSMVLNFLAH